MQKKDLGTQAINVRLALCKVCITACFAIALSLFLFACGSSKDSSATDSTSAAMHTDTPATTAPIDTAAAPGDTTMHPDSTHMH
ncbi:hypothetical protein SAMN05661012_01157 [Chitinophaga sancti]|nr:hypothetical protein SAMN05661012_01157 [Chitinophaga sancti]